MKKNCFTVIFMALFCLLTISNGLADGILFGEIDMGNFDEIVHISTNDVFASPGMILDADYTETYDSTYDVNVFNTWGVTYVSDYVVTAAGDDIDVLLWFYSFNTAYESTPFSFDFYCYLDDTLIDWMTITYNGGTFGGEDGHPLNNSENYSFETHDLTQVPEPATMLLLGFGLLALSGLRRKF